MASDLIMGLGRQFVQGLVPNIIRQPTRNMDPMVRDTKDKGSFWYSALPSPALAEPVMDLYGREAVKGGTPASRLLVRAANKPTERLRVEELITDWNNNNPDDKYQPIDFRSSDYWAYSPDGGKVSIQDRRLRSQFEKQVGERLKEMHTQYASSLASPLPGNFKDKLQAMSTKARSETRKSFLKTLPKSK
jgi:hypothetical protein